MDRRTFLNSLALSARAATPPPRPNVILILTDDLGFRDLSCYGSKTVATPAIDDLARHGVRFANFYSNGPLCSPTRAALITGRYQQRVGIEYAWTPRDKGKGLPTTEPSLASLLKTAGYRTALFGKWHLGGDDKFSPEAHGFDEFFGLRGSDHDYYSHRRIDGHPDLWDGPAPASVNGYSTDLFTGRAVQFVQKNAAAPFFLYLAFNAPHWPFQPPDNPADVRTRDTWFAGTRRGYIEMVKRIDASVARIVAASKSTGRHADTLIIFTNDNGGERFSDNGMAFHHKMTLWEGGVRVPTIISWPARLPRGRVSRQVAITMDLTATILSAAGVAPPPDRPLEGIDLLPVLTNKSPEQTRTLFWRYQHTPVSQKSVRQGRWKYLRDSNYDLLFDLASDPTERKDLSFEHPEKVAELKNLLKNWEADVDKSAPPDPIK